MSDRIASSEYHANRCALDFLTVRHACPKGIYLTAPPDRPSEWEGVLFERQGPYAPAVLRFQIIFPELYPQSPPLIVFTTDVFHPLISPLTTYTYSNQDHESETVSASDQQRLPPGAFSLRHGFPHLFKARSPSTQDGGMSPEATAATVPQAAAGSEEPPPHIAVMLYYVRAALMSEEVLDSIPLEDAANSAAWHAWKAHRAKTSQQDNARKKTETALGTPVTKHQPGGARSPGEWNWNGVWEERVRKTIRNSLSEQAIYKQPGLSEDTIQFANIDKGDMDRLVPWSTQLKRSSQMALDSMT